MEWLALAMIPPIVWAAGSIIDKILVEKFIKNGIAAGMLTNIASGALPLILALFVPVSFPSIPIAAAIVCAGVLWGAGRITYCVGMSKEEASRVVPLLQLNPILILGASWLLFGERLDIADAAGFVLVLGGALLISVRRVESSFHFSAAMPWLLANNVLIAGAFLILKQFSSVGWWDALFLISTGFILSALVFLPIGKGVPWKRDDTLKVSGLIAALSMLIIIGRASFYSALELAPAAIVSVLAATSSVFILVMAIGFSQMAPGILKENLDRRTLIIKGVAMCLVVAGISIFAFA